MRRNNSELAKTLYADRIKEKSVSKMNQWSAQVLKAEWQMFD